MKRALLIAGAVLGLRYGGHGLGTSPTGDEILSPHARHKKAGRRLSRLPRGRVRREDAGREFHTQRGEVPGVPQAEEGRRAVQLLPPGRPARCRLAESASRA